MRPDNFDWDTVYDPTDYYSEEALPKERRPFPMGPTLIALGVVVLLEVIRPAM